MHVTEKYTEAHAHHVDGSIFRFSRSLASERSEFILKYRHLEVNDMDFMR